MGDAGPERPRFERRPPDPIEELSIQLERGSQMLQASLNNAYRRLAGLDEILGEVVEALAANALVRPDQVPAAIKAYGAAGDVDGEGPEHASGPAMDPAGDGEGDDPFRWPAVVLGNPTDDEPPGPPVDCTARMPVCHAVCCMLKFALTADEVEQGEVKWDIGHPYLIRGDRDGYCVHNEPGGNCGVYEHRPRVCRRYSCVNDDRIWTDFDAMVLNTEWIDAHLPNTGKVSLRLSKKGGS